MRPRVGSRNLVSRLKQVVLPAPLGPMSAWMLPRRTRRFTPLTAMKPLNSRVMSSVSRIQSSFMPGLTPLGRALLEEAVDAFARVGQREVASHDLARARVGAVQSLLPLPVERLFAQRRDRRTLRDQLGAP